MSRRTIASSPGTSTRRATRAESVTAARMGASAAGAPLRSVPPWVVAFAGTLLLAPSALGSPEYPSVIQDELGMPCAPQCTLCHTTNPGRAGTADQPFVDTLGVASGDPDGLRSALQGLAGDGATAAPDTDGDGATDASELSVGHDPNVQGEGDICALDVRYGCGARVEPQGPLSPAGSIAAMLTVLGLGLLARRRPARR